MREMSGSLATRTGRQPFALICRLGELQLAQSAQRLTMRTRWIGQAALVGTLLVGQVNASPGGIDVASDEVYLDLTTHRFSSRLTAKPGYQINIAVIDSKNAHVTLYYWPKDGDTSCPAANTTLPSIPDGARERAGAPSGAPDVDKQKYVFKIGPLKYAQRYCFATEVSVTRDLTATEKEAVNAALDATVFSFFDAPPPPCSRPDSVPSACIAQTFESQLGWPPAALAVNLPSESQAIPFKDAFLAFLNTDAGFKHSLEQALGQAHSSSALSASALIMIARAKAAVDGWIADPTLDPISNEKPADLVTKLKALHKDALVKELEPAMSDKSKFIVLLRKYRAALAQEAPTVVKGSAQLKNLLLDTGDAEPTYFRIDHKVFQGEIEPLLTAAPAALTAGLDALFAKYPSPDVLVKMSGYSDASLGDLKRVLIELAGARTLMKQWALAKARVTSLTRDNPGYAAFRDRLQSVAHRLESGKTMQFEPSYADRFPLYVSADVGFAEFQYLNGKAHPSEGELLPYFGLNCYFTPLDKDEALPGNIFREPGRRFALMAGLTLASTSGHGALGISGPVSGKVPMLGVGYRLTDYIRLGAGSFMYYQASNPLSDDKKTKAGLYISASMDLDVVGTVEGWASNAKLP